MRRLGYGVLAVCGALLLLGLFNLFQPSGPPQTGKPAAYTDLLNAAEEHRMRSATIQGRSLHATMTDGQSFDAYLPDDPTLAGRLASQGVTVRIKPEEADDLLLKYALSWVPILLLTTVWVLYLRRIAAAVRAVNATLVRQVEALERQAGRSVEPSP